MVAQLAWLVSYWRMKPSQVYRRTGRRWLRTPIGLLARMAGGEFCDACGGITFIRSERVLGDQLVEQWELDAAWAALVNLREGATCLRCGCNHRSRHLAQQIVRVANQALSLEAKSLNELCRMRLFREWRVAEINSVGGLHPFLHWTTPNTVPLTHPLGVRISRTCPIPPTTLILL